MLATTPYRIITFSISLYKCLISRYLVLPGSSLRVMASHFYLCTCIHATLFLNPPYVLPETVLSDICSFPGIRYVARAAMSESADAISGFRTSE